MISRREFVTGSIAATAATLLGCQKDSSSGGRTTGPGGKAHLTVMFIGGTVFAKGNDRYIALQLRGHGVEYEHHKLEHMSFVVAPHGYLSPAVDLDAQDVEALPASVTSSTKKLQSACLVGRDITISGTNTAPIHSQCKQLVEYGHISGGWTRKDWTPGNDKAVSSRFTLWNGTLGDGNPLNTNAAAYKWYVKDKNKEKSVSDVTELVLDADVITIDGLNPSGPLELKAGDRLLLAVFSGPLQTHGSNHKYQKISHAYLMTTIYDIGATPIDDLFPRTDTEVNGMEGSKIKNPCEGDQPRMFVPPDSEYCPNTEGKP